MIYSHFTALLLEDFYIIQSAETLHEYHNVPLKEASSMMAATRRNYIKCLSASCVICRHVTIFNFPKIFKMNGENYLKIRLSIISRIFSTNCHTIGGGIKAYRLSQMIKPSFQHTAFFLWPVNSPLSKDVHSGALYLNLQLHPTTTLFPKVWVYLGVRTCELFLCFVAFVRVRVYYVDFFVLFVLRHW